MEFFTQPEITQGYNWFCNVQPQKNDTDKTMDISPFDDFIEFDWATQFSYQSNQLSINGFNDLENFNFDFNRFEVDQKPLNVVLPEMGHYTDKAESGFVEASVKTGNGFVNKQEKWENQEPLSLTSSAAESRFVSFVKRGVEGENQELPLPLPSSSSSISIIRKRSSSLQFDDIRKHFDVPINLAAKKMNVGLTLLKKRCRELNITRWPHRKLRSLTVLINNLKEMGLANEVDMLEKKKKMLEKLPEMELNEEIKKLRQACFKAKYKKRRLITLSP